MSERSQSLSPSDKRGPWSACTESNNQAMTPPSTMDMSTMEPLSFDRATSGVESFVSSGAMNSTFGLSKFYIDPVHIPHLVANGFIQVQPNSSTITEPLSTSTKCNSAKSSSLALPSPKAFNSQQQDSTTPPALSSHEKHSQGPKTKAQNATNEVAQGKSNDADVGKPPRKSGPIPPVPTPIDKSKLYARLLVMLQVYELALDPASPNLRNVISDEEWGYICAKERLALVIDTNPEYIEVLYNTSYGGRGILRFSFEHQTQHIGIKPYGMGNYRQQGPNKPVELPFDCSYRVKKGAHFMLWMVGRAGYNTGTKIVGILGKDHFENVMFTRLQNSIRRYYNITDFDPKEALLKIFREEYPQVIEAIQSDKISSSRALTLLERMTRNGQPLALQPLDANQPINGKRGRSQAFGSFHPLNKSRKKGRWNESDTDSPMSISKSRSGYGRFART